MSLSPDSPGFAELLALRSSNEPPGIDIIPGDSMYAGRYPLQETTVDVLAAIAVSVNDIWQIKTDQRQHASINSRHAAAALNSYTYLNRKKAGQYAVMPTSSAAQTAYQITTPFTTRDGRWFLPHFGLVHLKERMMSLLDCEDTADSVAASILSRDSHELEQAIAAAGACGGIVRSVEEWNEHPQGQALLTRPVIEIEKIGDSKPEPFKSNGPALAGIRVLDLTRILAGPVAARTCAEHGADVLMATARHTPQIKNFVIDLSHGKRSCFLNLNNPADASTMRSLISQSDVFSQGYRPGVLAARGFGPEELATLRPGLIYLSTSCYGQHGPWADRAGWEQVAQAVTGICHKNDAENPALLPVNACDFLTGYLGAYGILLALLKRAHEGGSYHINVSLCQSAMFLNRQPQKYTTSAPANLTDTEAAAFQMHSETAYGSLRHLAPVIKFSESKAAWQRPSPALGADQPEWLNR